MAEIGDVTVKIHADTSEVEMALAAIRLTVTEFQRQTSRALWTREMLIADGLRRSPQREPQK